MSKPKPDITDPRTLAIESLKRLGGIEGFVSWAKTHRTLYYSLYAKLMAQPLVQNNVTVNVRDDGEARQKLQDAFYRIIDERQKGEEPAVYVDGERLRDPVYVGGERLIEHQPADPRLPTLDAVEHSDPKSPKHGSPFSRGGVATTPGETNPGGGQKPKSHYSLSIPGLAAGAALDESADNRSTTEKYLTWSGSGGGTRTSPKDWGPV
jgi:hypothetical protein